MNQQLIEVANAKGYVVKSITPHKPNSFGNTDLVTIENGEHRITFITNVLHGVNYFYMVELDRYLQGRVYRAQRYFYKFTSLLSRINGETFIALKKEETK